MSWTCYNIPIIEWLSYVKCCQLLDRWALFGVKSLLLLVQWSRFFQFSSTFRWVSEWNCWKLWYLKSFQIVSSQVNSYNDTVQFHKHQSSLKCLNSCLRFYFQKSTMFDLDFHFQPRELQISKILCQPHVSMLSKSSMNWFSWRWQAWWS